MAMTFGPKDSPEYEGMIRNAIGLALVRDAKYDEALEQFRTAVRLSPNLAQAQLNLANSLASSGESGGAVSHYEAALAGLPDSIEARVGLGNVLLRERRAADAAVQFNGGASPRARSRRGAQWPWLRARATR